MVGALLEVGGGRLTSQHIQEQLLRGADARPVRWWA